MRLGDRIRSLRKEKNLTLHQFSALADLSVPFLSNMERDVVNPSIDTLKKIGKAHNMSVGDIFNGVDGLNRAPDNLPIGLDELCHDPEYHDELTDDWMTLLLNVRLAGRYPETKRDWLSIYFFMRRFFGK